MSIEFNVVPIPGSESSFPKAWSAAAAPKPIVDTLLCPNCNQRFQPSSGRDMFCSLQCKDEAKTVRYARRKNIEYPDAMPEDIEYAIKIRIAHTLSGGYDGVARTLTTEIREAVIHRDGGKCVTCGEPGDEIDHIDGPSPDITNLRLLCVVCHHAITEQHLNPITDTETAQRLETLLARIDAEVPMLTCDNEQTWATEWRAWRTAHATWE